MSEYFGQPQKKIESNFLKNENDKLFSHAKNKTPCLTSKGKNAQKFRKKNILVLAQEKKKFENNVFF